MKVHSSGTGRGLRATIGCLLVFALALVGAGCDSSDSGSDGAERPASAEKASPHVGKRLAIVQNILDGYNTQVACGAVEEGKRLGFEVAKPQGPKQYSATEQVAITNSVLARDPDALVYIPADAKSALPPVKAAVNDGLKIATIDTNLSDASVVTSFIASDHYAGGKAAAEELLRQIGGKGKVLVEGIVPDHPITRGRVGGFESVIKTAPGVEYIGARYPEVDIAKIAGDVAAMLRAHPDIKAIYTTQSVFSAAGAVAALRDAGLAGKVKLVSWDYDDAGAKYLKSGEVSALVAQNPREMGRMAVTQLANAFDGKPVTKEVHPPVTVVTQANKSEPEMAKLPYAEPC